MIDNSVLDSLSPSDRANLQAACSIILRLNIVSAQSRLNSDRLVFGPPDEDVASVANRVLDYRRNQAALVGFQQLLEQEGIK